MPKKPRNTPISYETSIRDGRLYFEDVAQAEIDTEQFTEIIDDKHTTSLRLVSLASNWEENDWLSGVGYVKFSLKLEMTLRAEIRSGTKVWYAYRRVGGILFKRYVGQSEAVTTKRLVAVAQRLPGI